MTGGDPVCFGETRYALHDFQQARASQIVKAMLLGLCGQLQAITFLHDNTGQLWSYFNYFIYSDSALKAVIALIAAVGVGFEHLKTSASSPVPSQRICFEGMATFMCSLGI